MKWLDRFPSEIRDDVASAVRLEWWTIGWIGSIIIVMGFAMGSSQAMRTAWIEDLLSIVPAVVFQVAIRLEARQPTSAFPFGFDRAHSLAFLISAVALTATGATLIVESALTLVRQEHATVPPLNLFGTDIWSGWIMVAALIYSVVPPFILGRLKLPIARRLKDEVLHTDAMMQKADWMTGLAGVAGVIGLGLGFWWADAVAAAIISFSILHDGTSALRIAVAELADGTPRRLGQDRIDQEAEQLHDKLASQFPGATVRIRKTGRYMRAEVCGVEPDQAQDLAALWPGEPQRSWRLAEVSFVPPDRRG